MQKTQLIEHLESGIPTTLVVYGTSLSFHLAPLLREALTERFGETLNLVNSGLSGKASRTGLEELENKVLKHHPDTLLLEFAVNDAHSYEIYPGALDRGIDLEESRANLEAIIDRVRGVSRHCEIILQTMNPAYDAPGQTNYAGSYRPQLGDFYQGYREVASARGLKLIDNTAMWEEIRQKDLARFQELIPDGVHPTPAAVRGVLVPHLLRQLGVD